MNNYLGAGNSPTPPTSYSTAELPSMFSPFFSAKIQNLRDKLDQTGTPLSCFYPVSEIEVSNTLKSMSVKPCELDPIPASLSSIATFYTCFLPSLASLRSGSFPTTFKTAIARPLLKNDNLDSNGPKNYRLSLTFRSFPSFMRKSYSAARQPPVK